MIRGCEFKCLSGKLEERGELTEREIIRAERNSGVISNKVREIQVCMSFFKNDNQYLAEIACLELCNHLCFLYQ